MVQIFCQRRIAFSEELSVIDGGMEVTEQVCMKSLENSEWNPEFEDFTDIESDYFILTREG